MKITKEYEGLVRAENGDYVLQGDLICHEDLEIDLDDRLLVAGKIFVDGYITSKDSLYAGGDLEATGTIRILECLSASGCISSDQSIEVGFSIQSNQDIKAHWGLSVGNRIKAFGCIEVGDGILAGMDIEAGSFISAGNRIFAGVHPLDTNEECKKTITCAELRSGEICYGELYIRD